LVSAILSFLIVRSDKLLVGYFYWWTAALKPKEDGGGRYKLSNCCERRGILLKIGPVATACILLR